MAHSRLDEGDPEAARVFCERYAPMLQRVADKYLADGMRRRVGPESVCQSVCLSFLRRAQAGEFQLPDSESLWQLLCAITLTKVREKARYHRRQKRNIERERPLNSPMGRNTDGEDFDLADPHPTNVDAVEFQEEFEALLADLDDEERQLVEIKLQQNTNEEAATKMGCSERTVRRILKRIQSKVSRGLQSG